MSLFDKLDRNHDGVLTREEFNRAMSPPGTYANAGMPMGTSAAYAPPFAFRPSAGMGMPGMQAATMPTMLPGVMPRTPTLQAAPAFQFEPGSGMPTVAQPTAVLVHSSPVTQVRAMSPEREATPPRRIEQLLPHKVAQLNQQANAALERDMRSLKERVEYLESLLGESVEKHTRELEALKAGHAQHARHLDAARSAQANALSAKEHTATIDERLRHVERLTETAPGLRDKLALLEAEVRELRDHLGGERVAREKLHGAVQETIRKHLSEDLAAREVKHGSLEGSLERLSTEKRALHKQHASLEERVRALELAAGDTGGRHGKELERLSQEKRSLEKNHASMEERMRFLEEALGDSADQHRKELEAAHGKIREAVDRHRKEIDSAHANLKAAHGRLDELHAHVVQHGAHAAANEERFSRLEQALGKSEGRIKGHVEGHVATLKERVEYLESMLGDSVDKHAKHGKDLEAAQGHLKAAHSRLDQLHAHVAQHNAHAAAHEERVSRLEQVVGKSESRMKGHLEGHVSTLKERVDYLESLLGESADKHSRELEAVRAAHAKQVRDHRELVTRASTLTLRDTASVEERLSRLEQLSDSQSSLRERVDFLEDMLGAHSEKHEKHANGLQSVHAKLDQAHNRLAAFEKHALEWDEYHRSHAALTPEEKAALDTHLQVLGSSLDKRSRELDGLKAAHVKHAKEMEAFKQEHHASIEERMKYIEKLLGDSADKHAKELGVAHSKLDQLHDRLATCEVQAGNAEARDIRSTPIGKRLEQLERAFAELRTSQEKLEVIQSKLTAVKEAWSHSL